ncbi:MAG: fatty acid desaturase [Dongiaceae bacterium]
MGGTPKGRDYSLTGPQREAAIAAGLANAKWYASPVPRKQLKALMQRRDGPALRDTAIWLALLAGTGTAGALLWGSWWAVPFFLVYGVLYGSSGDSRWHECGHGTAFRTRWLNDAVYWLACFFILREPTWWRWSHARHHTDTIIVGRDPEIAAPRPPKLHYLPMDLLQLHTGVESLLKILRHCGGRLRPWEEDFIPAAERPKVIREARIFAAILAASAGLSIGLGSAAAADAGRAADLLWRLAGAGAVRLHPACRARRGRARPPAQLPHRPHEPGVPLPLLEHELPRRAPHVPDGALPRFAAAARGDQG